MSRTEADIKRAFLQVLSEKPLADMSISEVARAAHISRSTFYLHYQNLGDLYDEAVSDLFLRDKKKTAPYKDGGEPSSDYLRPFYTMIHSDADFQTLAKEDRFLATILHNPVMVGESKVITQLIESGLDFSQAYAVFLFQMSGCLSVATMLRMGRDDWRKIQKALNSFSQGGIQALSKSEG